MSLNEQFAQQQNAFKKQTPTSGDLITGVSVPVSLDRNGAKLRLYVNLNAAVLESPQALNAALDQIESVFDLDTWSPNKQSQGDGFKKPSSSGYGNSYNNRRY